MRKIVLTLCVILAGCRNTDRVREQDGCGQPCYLGTQATVNRGVCQPGTWECEPGQAPVCVGATVPVSETCNGLDDDCDGKVDEDLYRDCKNGCGVGLETCSAGTWTGCTAPEPRPEICNGQDDDCDGLVDEPEDLPVEFCYSGTPETLIHGGCHPGTYRCVQGSLVCTNEQLPVPEACNGLDDDCDGAIDEGSPDEKPVDLVFVIDNSTSMLPYIINVVKATQSWSAKYAGRPDLRFAVVTAPDDDDQYGDMPHLDQNFTDAAGLNAALKQQHGSSNAWLEDTIGALNEIADPANPLKLNWKPGSRHLVVVFSDEVPQSAATPPLTTSDVTQRLLASQVLVNVFTSKAVFDDWRQVPTTTGGVLTDIRSDAMALEAQLDSAIRLGACQ